MLSMTVIIVFIFSLLYLLGGFINIVEGYEPNKYMEIYVKGGDTIWGIARKYSSKAIDIRESIYKIERLNKLESFNIRPGQLIKVPIE